MNEVDAAVEIDEVDEVDQVDDAGEAIVVGVTTAILAG